MAGHRLTILLVAEGEGLVPALAERLAQHGVQVELATTTAVVTTAFVGAPDVVVLAGATRVGTLRDMSWGYFAELVLSLPIASLKALKKQMPADVVLPPGWAGLRDPGLEAAFGRRLTTAETFEETLAWFASAPSLPAVRSEHVVEGRASLRVLTMLEKSLLDHAFPLAALFHAARDRGGEGSFRLVNDGTSGGESGVELTLADGTITARRLDDDWELLGRLGAELFGGEGRPSPEGEAARPRKKSRAEPQLAPKPSTRARKSEGSKAGALFERFIARGGRVWLTAGRSLDEILPQLDGEAQESSLGVLRSVHSRRSPASGAPASATEAAARLSLRAGRGALDDVRLVIPADPSDVRQLTDAELEGLGTGWKAGVTALAKELGLERVTGMGKHALSFRGRVDDVALELGWARTASAAGGKLIVGYQASVRRL